jgi:hypothetical protein
VSFFDLDPANDIGLFELDNLYAHLGLELCKPCYESPAAPILPCRRLLTWLTIGTRMRRSKYNRRTWDYREMVGRGFKGIMQEVKLPRRQTKHLNTSWARGRFYNTTSTLADTGHETGRVVAWVREVRS